jgi:hypothetical protein
VGTETLVAYTAVALAVIHVREHAHLFRLVSLTASSWALIRGKNLAWKRHAVGVGVCTAFALGNRAVGDSRAEFL